MVYIRIKRNLPKLIRFGCVGSLGALINFATYYVLVEFLHASVNIGAIGAFGVAVSNNYVLNHFWTFAAENERNPLNVRQYVYYFAGNLLGLGINLAVLNLVILNFGMEAHLPGQGAGILCGMLANFVVAKKLIFVKRERETG